MDICPICSVKKVLFAVQITDLILRKSKSSRGIVTMSGLNVGRAIPTPTTVTNQLKASIRTMARRWPTTLAHLRPLTRARAPQKQIYMEQLSI